jgi:hypothetical protein
VLGQESLAGRIREGTLDSCANTLPGIGVLIFTLEFAVGRQQRVPRKQLVAEVAANSGDEGGVAILERSDALLIGDVGLRLVRENMPCEPQHVPCSGVIYMNRIAKCLFPVILMILTSCGVTNDESQGEFSPQEDVSTDTSSVDVPEVLQGITPGSRAAAPTAPVFRV